MIIINVSTIEVESVLKSFRNQTVVINEKFLIDGIFAIHEIIPATNHTMIPIVE